MEIHSDTGSRPVQLAIALYRKWRIVRHNTRVDEAGRMRHKRDSASRKRLGEFELGGWVRDLVLDVNEDGAVTPNLTSQEIDFLRERVVLVLTTERPSDPVYKIAEALHLMLEEENLARAVEEEAAYRKDRQQLLIRAHQVEVWDGKGKNPVSWSKVAPPYYAFYFINKSGKRKAVGVWPYREDIDSAEEGAIISRCVMAHVKHVGKFRFFRGPQDLDVLEKGGLIQWFQFNREEKEKEALAKGKKPRVVAQRQNKRQPKRRRF
jgi:hypothetical protein